MFGECHAHIFMNGIDYQQARRAYEAGIDREEIRCDIRKKLKAYQDRNITFIRDGGDHYGAGVYARSIAEEYGIDYRTPVFAIHKNGHYGGIVGRGFDTMPEYAKLVSRVKAEHGDFIKVMLSGIMDFAGDGGITGTPLGKEEIGEMIHIAHEEGFAVMAHVNGAKTVRQAILCGVDSIEHGNFMDDDCLQALAQSNTVWVPTHVTIRNLLYSSRFDHNVIRSLRAKQAENIVKAVKLGAVIALGSDAGAFMVPHASGTVDELREIESVLGNSKMADQVLEYGEKQIRERFSHR